MKKNAKRKLNKRERKKMCKKIKEIHKLSPAEIRERYWKNMTSPVDMISLLHKMGISCIPVKFDHLETDLNWSKGNIHGLAYSDEDDLGILYSEGTQQAINYVLAHELGHCCLHLPVSTEFHVELNTDEDIYEPAHKNRFWKKMNESEANAFAAELLIPTNSLLIQLAENEKPTIEALSKHFNVPTDLVLYKLNSLVK